MPPSSPGRAGCQPTTKRRPPAGKRPARRGDQSTRPLLFLAGGRARQEPTPALPRIGASAPARRPPSCHHPGALPGRSRPAALATFPHRKRPAQVAGADVPSCVARWRGKFRAAGCDDPRYDVLARKDRQRSSWIPISSSISPSTDGRRPRNSTGMRRLPLITTVRPGQGRPLVRPHETRGERREVYGEALQSPWLNNARVESTELWADART